MREMYLFPEWYVAKHLQVMLDEKQNAALETVFQRILQNNLAQPRVFVHRDYHSRNLMVSTLIRYSGFSGCGLWADHL